MITHIWNKVGYINFHFNIHILKFNTKYTILIFFFKQFIFIFIFENLCWKVVWFIISSIDWVILQLSTDIVRKKYFKMYQILFLDLFSQCTNYEVILSGWPFSCIDTLTYIVPLAVFMTSICSLLSGHFLICRKC